MARCLDALAAQSLAQQLEVVVVDDGSLAEAQVASIVDGHPSARLIRRDGAGPAAARNAGARTADGSFLCFTDDDCVPQPDWAEQMADALQKGADAAAGATTLSRSGALAEASELIAQALAALPPPAGSDVSFAASNNVACTRSTFEAVPFDETYPNAAAEDREWCARLMTSGLVLRSVPAARVVHNQELTLRGFIRQQHRYGQGAFRFRRRSGERRSLEPPAFYGALLRRAFARGLGVGLLVCAAQAATAAGFVGAWVKARSESRSVRSAGPSASSISPGEDPRA